MREVKSWRRSAIQASLIILAFFLIVLLTPIHYSSSKGATACREDDIDEHWGFGLFHDPTVGKGMLSCSTTYQERLYSPAQPGLK